MIAPSVTTSRFSLAISSPITLLPGMTSTTRTLSTDSARARSLASAVIWLAFTPGAGRSSKRVTTGPGCTATTSASMVKSLSFISTSRDSASSASAEYSGSRGGGASSRLSGGGVAPLWGVANGDRAVALDARALLEHRQRRLDARRRPRGGLALLTLHRLLARLAPFAALGGIARR